MSVKKEIVLRLSVVYFMILFVAVVISGRIVYLQVFEHDKWSSKAQDLTYQDIIIKPNRGDICDTDGRILASSIPYYEVRMDLNSSALRKDTFDTYVDSLAGKLAELFENKTAEEYSYELKTARDSGARYHLIKANVNYQQVQKLKTFPIFNLGKYKGGLIIRQNYKRVQPHINLASRTIGYLSKSEKGNIVGLEGAYDHILRGVEGVHLMQKLSGNVWMPLNDENEIDPKDGKDIITTIDVNIQDVASKALRKQLILSDADHGTVILMEVHTGDIKAIVNLQKVDEADYRETYNFAIGESTEPGSTFKLASMIVALEDGYVKPTDTIDTGNGIFKYNKFEIRDSRYGGYGRITVQQVLEKSSNIGIAKIITKYYEEQPARFINRLYSMNLNQRLGIAIKGEATPYIKYPGDKFWSGISLPQMSIGYELEMTPLQVLTFYNAIANDGRMMKPRFIKSIGEHGQMMTQIPPKVINPSICSKETVKIVQSMLEGVVTRGTAHNLYNKNLKIAGKTGTSQLAKGTKGYKINDQKTTYQASFAGYFPADNPKYSCIIVVNTPSNDKYYGNVVAGPVFKEIADKVYATSFDIHAKQQKQFLNMHTIIEIPYSKHGNRQDLNTVFRMLHIPIDQKKANSPWVITKTHKDHVEYQVRRIKNNVVPPVKGMGARDAIYLLESAGLKVRVVGRGFVKSQSIAAGRAVRKGTSITIILA